MNLEIQIQLQRNLDDPNGPAPGERVVLAVSGGVDSMVMLHAIAALIREDRLRLRLAAAHLNHGLRGNDAGADQALVERSCRDLGIPLHVGRARIDPVGSLETRARAARRRFLIEAAHRFDSGYVLLAHHADDQAETVLDRVLSGAGPDGLRGMRRRHCLPASDGRTVTILRPLLGITRAEIERFARRHAIPFRRDATNEDVRHRRNRLRHLVMPHLREHGNPNLSRALVRLASVMEETADAIEVTARTVASRLTMPVPRPHAWLLDREPEGLVGLDRRAFKRLPQPLRASVLRAVLGDVEPARPPLPGHGALTDLIHRLVNAGGHAHPWRIRRRLHAVMDAELAIFCREPLAIREDRLPELPARPGTSFTLPGAGLSVRSRRIAAPAENGAGMYGPRLHLDAERLEPRLVVRAPRTDEPFLGPGAGSAVPVLRYLKKRGIPALRRRLALVLAGAESNRIHAVLGVAVSATARVTSSTRDVWVYDYEVD